MANMVLSAYTFPANPSEIPVIMEKVDNAVVKTYSSYAYFSWGKTIVGTLIRMVWAFMEKAQWDQFYTLYQSDVSMVWDPQDGSSKTYNVRIMSLDGEYHIAFSGSDVYRKNVSLVLLIESEIV